MGMMISFVNMTRYASYTHTEIQQKDTHGSWLAVSGQGGNASRGSTHRALSCLISEPVPSVIVLHI